MNRVYGVPQKTPTPDSASWADRPATNIQTSPVEVSGRAELARGRLRARRGHGGRLLDPFGLQQSAAAQATAPMIARAIGAEITRYGLRGRVQTHTRRIAPSAGRWDLIWVDADDRILKGWNYAFALTINRGENAAAALAAGEVLPTRSWCDPSGIGQDSASAP